MERKISLLRGLFSGLVCLLIGSAVTTAPVESFRDGARSGLEGFVHSAAGEALTDVELLVFPSHNTTKPLARLTTDRNGRFEGPLLPPGPYRIAAIKEGYGTLLTLIDLFRRRPLDLILKPESLIESDRRALYPKESSWVLRLPDRNPLREHSADWRETPLDAEQAAGGLHAYLDQVIAFRGRASAAAVDVSGRETGWKLEQVWSGHSRIALLGRVGQFDRSDDSEQLWSDEGLDLEFKHTDEKLGTFSVYGFYDRRTPLVLWAPVEASAGISPGDYRGLDIGGRQSFAENRQLEWMVGYRGSEVDGSERLGFTADYSMMPSPRHRLQGVLQVDSARFSSPLAGPAEVFAKDGALRLRIDDSWRVSSHWAVNYGVGVSGFAGEAEKIFTVPQLGVQWSPGFFRAEAGIRYHSPGTKSEALSTDDFAISFGERVRQRIGYEVRIDGSLPGGVLLWASIREDPFVIRPAGSFERRSQDPVTALGDTEYQQAQAGLLYESPGFGMQLSLSDGEMRGRHSLQARYGYLDTAWDWIPIEFREARVAWTMPRAGSEISLEWNRMAEKTLAGTSVERSMEWRLLQVLDGPSDQESHWRLLLAWRQIDLDAPRIASGKLSLQQIRSGLRVSF